jgi:hypothetical protein
MALNLTNLGRSSSGFLPLIRLNSAINTGLCGRANETEREYGYRITKQKGLSLCAESERRVDF